MRTWWNEYVSQESNPLINQDITTLIQRSLHTYEGQLSSNGCLVVQTGKFLGRASSDKYIVKDSYTEQRIDWSKNKTLSQIQFDNIKNEFIRKFNSRLKNVYIMEGSVSADLQYALGVRLITTQASQAVFAKHIFRNKTDGPKLGHFCVIHCPEIELDFKSFGIRSSTIVAINFETKEILIGGTNYSGEIKKAIFSVMNTILPDYGVLPMHAAANIDERGDVSLFFGLSGTGKTTLSSDVGKMLIGDDEHGLTENGVFNLEGGCYAKTFQLDEKKEPNIYHAINRFGTLLENVKLNNDHTPLFADKSITENGRATYPLSYLESYSFSGKGRFPKKIFFLSADAMGVLPAVAKLETYQALYFFLLGYTSKLAGTDLESSGVKATFSHSFGAPFMMRHPLDYANLLKKYLEDSDATVWLVNTGWFGGPYQVGERFDLDITRTIVREIQKELPLSTPFENLKPFDFMVPRHISGIEDKYLSTESLWGNSDEYTKVAEELKKLFDENIKNMISNLKEHEQIFLRSFLN